MRLISCLVVVLVGVGCTSPRNEDRDGGPDALVELEGGAGDDRPVAVDQQGGGGEDHPVAVDRESVVVDMGSGETSPDLGGKEIGADRPTCSAGSVGSCCGDEDCGTCQKCVANKCQNQTAAEDLKSECAPGACRTGNCNGSGACDIRTAGADPANICQGTTCSNGNCAAGGVCAPTPAGQAGPGCSGACQTCNGALACGTSPTQATCYRDSDGDGFGDAAVSLKFCDGICASGYVKDATDCYDKNKLAHPYPKAAPIDYQLVNRGDGSFDYDCDGHVSTELRDSKNATCTMVGTMCVLNWPEYAASVCGTGVPATSCNCTDACMFLCRSYPATTLKCR